MPVVSVFLYFTVDTTNIPAIFRANLLMRTVLPASRVLLDNGGSKEPFYSGKRVMAKNHLLHMT